ncbi:MAG: response regulator [Longimicrobiales bacterium]
MQRPEAHLPPRLTPIAVTYSVIVLTLVLLFYFGVVTLSGVRGFVGAESSWSKAQKQASACLHQYATSKTEEEYECYVRHSGIMMAGRRARTELQRVRPDVDTARAYFVKADVDVDDAGAMVAVFRKFGWHPLMKSITATWTKGDVEVEHMHMLARRLRERVQNGATHIDPDVDSVLKDIRATDDRLTILELEFSHKMGLAARTIQKVLLVVLFVTAALLLGTSLYFSSRWIASWEETQRLARKRAARMRAVAGAAAGVGSTTTMVELDRVLREAITQVIESDMVTFGIYHAEDHTFHYLAGEADGRIVAPQVVSAAGTPSERFLGDRTSILIDHSGDPRGHGAYRHGSPRRSESVIRSAMYSGTRLLGVIAVHSYSPHVYTQDDVEVMEILASVAASGIHRFESTREQLAAEEELRRSQEQLAQAHKMEAVGLLAGGIAHDFNNLLTAIKGNSDLLAADGGLSPDLAEHVSEIAAAADRAAALTGQLLAFSRRQVLQPRVVNLNSLVLAMSTLIRRLIGEDVELSTSLDEELWNVKADPHQMEQVVLNLAINSRDAIPEHGTLIISTTNVELTSIVPQMPSIPPGSYVRLSVEDSGIGISPEVRARIFEPFFTTKGVGKGTGLGLSTVYGIVKQSDGYIYVQSAPELGTTMQIFLPRTEDALDPPLPESAPRPRVIPSKESTVLVVEDESTVRTLLSRVLTREGYRVIEAGTGDEALAILSADFRVDLLLTDTVMPGMSGVALAERASVLRPGLAVLHMSGYTEDEVFRRGLSRRGDAFLQKPFSPAVLLEGVADALTRVEK